MKPANPGPVHETVPKPVGLETQSPVLPKIQSTRCRQP